MYPNGSLTTHTQRPPEAGAGLEETMNYCMPSNYRNMTSHRRDMFDPFPSI